MDEQNTPLPTPPSQQPEPQSSSPIQQTSQPLSQGSPPQPELNATGIPMQANQPIQPQVAPSFTQQTVTTKPRKKTAPIIVGLILVVLLAGAVFAYASLSGYSKKEDTENNVTDPKTATSVTTDDQIADATARAEGRLLKSLLFQYYTEGVGNSDVAQSRDYYPSKADMKNTKWFSENIKAPQSVIDGLAKGTYIYKSSGCDSATPSSSTNKCSGYKVTIKLSDGSSIEETNDSVLR